MRINVVLKMAAWLVLLMGITASAYAAGDTRLHTERMGRLTDYIERSFKVERSQAAAIVTEATRYGIRYGVQPEMILAIIAVESTFQERAVSSGGARGLMQIQPGSHGKAIREIGGVQSLFVAEKNISLGARILSDYLDLSGGNMQKALLRYNGSLGDPKARYATKVLAVYHKLRAVSAAPRPAEDADI